eukprot:1151341-Pelagomonas_calceolata.AAC.1
MEEWSHCGAVNPLWHSRDLGLAALRSSNHAVMSGFAGGHWGSVLVGGPIGTGVQADAGSDIAHNRCISWRLSTSPGAAQHDASCNN